MQTAKPSLFARDDTFFGVCEGLAEDVRFNPLWLRLVFTLAVFVNPVAAVSVYLALGVVIFATRWFLPASASVATSNPEAATALVHSGNDEAPVPTALAA